MNQSKLISTAVAHNRKSEDFVVNYLWPHEFKISEMPNCKILTDSLQISAKISKISSFLVEVVIPKSKSISINSNYKLSQISFKLKSKRIALFDIDLISEKSVGNSIVLLLKINSEDHRYEGVKLKPGYELYINSFHPIENKKVTFKVTKIAREKMTIESSYTNRVILPNMTFKGYISLPQDKTQMLKFKVIGVKPDTLNRKQIIDISLQKISRDFENSLNSYILLFGTERSLVNIKRLGFKSKTLQSSITSRYCSNDKEYQEVLKLRRKSYLTRGGTDNLERSEQDLSVFSDEFDKRARILNIYQHNRLVATGRSVFTESGQKMELEKYIDLPRSFPSCTDCFEISRLCIDPDYRNTDLIISLFRGLMLIGIESKKNHCIATSPIEMIDSYRKTGFKKLGKKFTIDELNGNGRVELHVLGIALPDLFKGKGVHPITWYLVFSQTLNLALFNGFITRDKVYNTRAYFNNIIGIISFHIYSFVRKWRNK